MKYEKLWLILAITYIATITYSDYADRKIGLELNELHRIEQQLNINQ